MDQTTIIHLGWMNGWSGDEAREKYAKVKRCNAEKHNITYKRMGNFGTVYEYTCHDCQTRWVVDSGD